MVVEDYADAQGQRRRRGSDMAKDSKGPLEPVDGGTSGDDGGMTTDGKGGYLTGQGGVGIGDETSAGDPVDGSPT
jgi:hypothetical protein